MIASRLIVVKYSYINISTVTTHLSLILGSFRHIEQRPSGREHGRHQTYRQRKLQWLESAIDRNFNIPKGIKASQGTGMV